MARRRLTPAQEVYLDATLLQRLSREAPVLPAPPIAQVAGDSSATAALAELGAAMVAARAEGRLVQALPLDAIDADHLVRDRVAMDDMELVALAGSLRIHGQRAPIDVTDLGSGRYGLISGLRRLTALRRLHDETGAFPTVLALLRKPADAGKAYVAMVEENEVRQGLSYYERARIAACAVEIGVFSTERAALQALFATASRARRSKIGSFLSIYRALGDALRFPAAIPERLGLQLSAALAVTGRAEEIRAALLKTPALDAPAEAAHLARLLAQSRPTAGSPDSRPSDLAVDARLRDGRLIVKITGAGATPALRDRLLAWLARQD